jgi:hypothetical protein
MPNSTEDIGCEDKNNNNLAFNDRKSSEKKKPRQKKFARDSYSDSNQEDVLASVGSY